MGVAGKDTFVDCRTWVPLRSSSASTSPRLCLKTTASTDGVTGCDSPAGPAGFLLMSNDLTGCPGLQPKGEGARDHVTARASRLLPPFLLPRRFGPLLFSLLKFHLLVHYLSLSYVKIQFFFFSSSFPPGKHAVLVQNGPCTSLIGAWVPLNFWGKIQNLQNASNAPATTC